MSYQFRVWFLSHFIVKRIEFKETKHFPFESDLRKKWHNLDSCKNFDSNYDLFIQQFICQIQANKTINFDNKKVFILV